uniref:WWE domain-containing protein n=1 Tax=Macrostomum lignano TaxID=282301 RepID=A0A1I8FCP6_9PLAT
LLSGYGNMRSICKRFIDQGTSACISAFHLGFLCKIYRGGSRISDCMRSRASKATSYGVLERFPAPACPCWPPCDRMTRRMTSTGASTTLSGIRRCSPIFLHFYRTDELHIRHNLCGNVVKREFEFWGMYEQDIEPAGWTSYSQAAECKETLAGIDNTFLTGKAAQKESWEAETNGWIKFRRKVWAILEDPSTSMASR